MSYLISIIMGYFLGCFQTAYIVAKRTKHIDIRDHGSGNSGTTNAIRVLGWKLGMLTFVGDILKAVLAVIIARTLFESQLAGLYAGAGVIIGHNWPFVLKFKGGKGIASTLGMLLAFDWRIGLVAWAVASLAIYLTRYVSLGSILLVTIMPIGVFILYPGGTQELIITSILAIVAIYRHKANIGRLIRGEENKLGVKKQAT
ncbi:glycerol-3-phosphate 1-O-acyltransferase PlsY [Petrocella sp. FN5]|uniref:glycerol-3-phosphate 1-O-acyltransferase PlsY n=1 Tax=Petrocella sp. FN5 TaxID=3032002 RepID=UPI0023DB978F|nr:glycerol-3-phosphate 1-O-acyltransferase PlsY [Petrocella sp. FN5]MDF1616371.1 glycerol-3-phosphate 1-O-acyltransferase PlsY [Petrocella sp. FN5]